MKKTWLTIFIILSTLAATASEFEYEYISEIPEITVSGAAATKLNCNISSIPLSRITKIQIDMKNQKSLVISNILGTSESETECSRKANQLICNAGFFDITIKDILASSNGTDLRAEFKRYGILGLSTKEVNCNLR